MRGVRSFVGLFRRFVVRHLLQERLRTTVTVLGIALGVGVVVAIQLANASSVAGFAAALETVSGKTSLEIVGVGPDFDELALNELGWLRAYGDVSPVVEGDAMARGPNGPAEAVRVLGVDILHDRSLREYALIAFDTTGRQPTPREFLTLLSDPASIVVSDAFARRHALSIGDELQLTTGDRAGRFVVRGLLANEGPAKALDGGFALMDIAAAQLAFDRLGRLDRVDVRLKDGVAI